jgi:predicted negative regulator of RcsB-dependent stress response
MLVELAQKHGDDALGQLATLNLVSLRIASGQGEQVAAELRAIVAGASQELPRDLALFELAKLYEKEKNYELARESLQQIVDDFRESPLYLTASQKLRELG